MYDCAKHPLMLVQRMNVYPKTIKTYDISYKTA